MKMWIVMLLLVATVVTLSGCNPGEISYYYHEQASIDGLQLYLNDAGDCCFAGAYTFSWDDLHREVTIPDEYNGYAVIQLGGYYGRGLPVYFYLIPDDDLMNVPKDNKYRMNCSIHPDAQGVPEEWRIQDLTFTLNIGKNLKAMENIEMEGYFPHIHEDGSITFYHPVVYINCSEENMYFYSEIGKLYDKETGELIPGVVYAQP